MDTNPIVAQLDSSFNVQCAGETNGFAYVSASGGTQPYAYLWSNGATDSFTIGLAPGTYTVTVTDVNGCSAIVNVILGNQAIFVSKAQTNIQCNTETDGSAVVYVSGGTAPYFYIWDNGSTDATATILR